MDGIVPIGASSEVGVAIDETRKDEVAGEIDDESACRNGEGCVFDGADAIALKDQEDVRPIVAGVAVKEITGLHIGDSGGCGEAAERSECDDEGENMKTEARHGAP